MYREITSTIRYENTKENLLRRFSFVSKISELKKIKPHTELCIIKTNFVKSELAAIKHFKSSNPNMDVWIASDNLSRENILLANEIGIKTVVPSSIDGRIVEDFFNKKDVIDKHDKKNKKNNYSGFEGLKVMIVDDNSMNVELLTEVLSGCDLNISGFLKPKEAYAKILHEKFDLFLLDIMMPEMSGFELAKKIKETSCNSDVPIIFISALSDSHNKIKGYDLGSCAYIEKPFDVNIIRSQIHSVLKIRQEHEQATSDKEDFLATIAHDLKTPIRAGINALNLLLNENFGELEDDQQEIIEDILYSTKFMKDMVENILCKNKIDSNQINLSKQVYPLTDVVENCIELTKYILYEKKQKIEFKCNTTNTLVPFDFLEMKRALHNLIANASQYSSEGGKILIDIFQFEDKIGVSIQDFGRGIEIKNQEDVFLQYMSYAKKYKTVGSGLGLYITKRIVEAHNGEILLESRIGYGTKITILLPTYDKV